MKHTTITLLTGAILLLMGGVGFGAPVCTPNLTTDHATIDASCEQLGRPIIVLPGAVYLVGWNDNFGTTEGQDYDFQDTFGTLTISPDLLPTWFEIGGISGSTNTIYVPKGPFLIGQELLLQNTVTWDGGSIDYISGHGGRNPDYAYDPRGGVHAWVERIDCSEVPEPSTSAMIVLGLGGVMFGIRKRTKTK